MNRTNIIIFLLLLVICNSCHHKDCIDYKGNYVYKLNGKDTYYFKITEDSLYSLLIPKNYSTGHRYNHLSCDTLEVFDMYHDKGDSGKYYISTNIIKSFTKDSIWIIDTDLKVFFTTCRASAKQEKKYDKMVYELLIPY